MSRPRKPDETMEQYRASLRLEAIMEKRIMRGKLVFTSQPIGNKSMTRYRDRMIHSNSAVIK